MTLVKTGVYLVDYYLSDSGVSYSISCSGPPILSEGFGRVDTGYREANARKERTQTITGKNRIVYERMVERGGF